MRQATRELADAAGAMPSTASALVPVPTPTASRARSAGALASNAAAKARLARVPIEMEQMVTSIDQRVTHVHQAEDARIRMLHDQAQRLIEGLQAMRVARDIHDERRVKELQMIESNVLLDLSNARQARSELEMRVEEIGNQRIAEYHQELRSNREQQESLHAELSSEIGHEVIRIGAALEEQRAARTQYGERVAASLEDEFSKLDEAIASEQKLRFEAESTMLRMVEDVCSRMRGEIQQERLEREAVQGKLLGLLEDTCNRIEGTFTFGARTHMPGEQQLLI
eukprot:CAMPEP_0117555802 /NCGR_PEP_ID=MMETSP0784-20121206/51466_1 /TAXON_ID=39447 /ORGANISM="" /LENGTH=282 /DNA_ID=CAMNT_0005353027 /DNA_START=108 /DNA_END=956 /DNA_ORIENTATION=+